MVGCTNNTKNAKILGLLDPEIDEDLGDEDMENLKILCINYINCKTYNDATEKEI